ncbi:MAG: glutamate 5-kinase [Clostridiales bacterium]|jgi:glutamate 5-kinase|nr:glutamate 5-kinase [Clostridiales bacterium]
MSYREKLTNAQKIVIKIGSSSLTHSNTGELDLYRLEKLTRIIANLRAEGKDIVLVSSGAIAVGSKAAGFKSKPKDTTKKQACAAIGQAILMMIYQKLFREYNQTAAQILLTRDVVESITRRTNTTNTFRELFELKAIPIVNENDTVSTDEVEFGDNDTLSAIVSSLINADLLILLSDIDGLFTDDPSNNPDATFISEVPEINDKIMNMGKGAGSEVGTGGMHTKLTAAQIATNSGTDMVIANANNLDVIMDIISGKTIGTLFYSNKKDDFHLSDYICIKN